MSGTFGTREFSDSRDLDLFLETLGKFERGEISAEAWRAFRLVHGTYGQRQDADAQMLRVKIPEGLALAHQLEAIADVAERYSRGYGHVSTRQNVQLHFVKLAEVEPAMRRLADAGLTTREACGNAVRNVTACPWAGVAVDERFDPTPYAEALTRHFLRHPLSSSLPRKFKIAFEGCPEDHAGLGIHDIGFLAQLREEGGRARRGFTVRAGGGTATLPTSARLLVDFLPAGEILDLAEAIVRVFHRLGDRQNRHANRLKFLVRKLGWEGFVAEVETERHRVAAEGGIPLPFAPEQPPVEQAPDEVARPAPPVPEAIAVRVSAERLRGPGIVPHPVPDLDAPLARRDAWIRSNTRPQRQPGYVAVTVTLPIGDVTAEQLRILAELSRSFADGAVRLTRDQNLVLRWVRHAQVAPLYRALSAAGLGAPGGGTLVDPASCPGAESCKLAVTQSRGLAALIAQRAEADPALVSAAGALDVRISGCPNGCSQHHVATIGLQGGARKVGGQAVPQYFVMIGGVFEGGEARFGRIAGKIPARRVPEAIARLVALYTSQRQPEEDARAFFARLPVDTAKKALAGLDVLTPEDLTATDTTDLGENGPFRPQATEGECAA